MQLGRWAFQSALALGIVWLGYQWWQQHGADSLRPAPIEHTQLKLHNATLSFFPEAGAPREQIYVKQLEYHNPQSALAHNINAFSQLRQIQSLKAEDLRLDGENIITQKPITLSASTQSLSAQGARYHLPNQQLFLTQPEITHVP